MYIIHFHFEVILIIYQIPCYNLICNKLYHFYISLLFLGKQFVVLVNKIVVSGKQFCGFILIRYCFLSYSI